MISTEFMVPLTSHYFSMMHDIFKCIFDMKFPFILLNNCIYFVLVWATFQNHFKFIQWYDGPKKRLIAKLQTQHEFQLSNMLVESV